MNEKLAQIEAFSQRGLSNHQIRLALGIEKFTKEELEIIEKGRAAGIAILLDKMFTRAKNGDAKAVDYLLKKFELIKPETQPESYIDQQLRILRNLKL